jgi:hypothetical protein
MEVPSDEGRTFASFEKSDVFLAMQNDLLSRPIYSEPTDEENRAEDDLLGRIRLMVGL